MATRTGRVEKRIHLEQPMQISSLQKPGSTDLPEKMTIENVSTDGVRVLTKRVLPPQERLLVSSLMGSEEPIPARVVYCQPLAEGVFGVGLQFERSGNGSKTVLPTWQRWITRWREWVSRQGAKTTFTRSIQLWREVRMRRILVGVLTGILLTEASLAQDSAQAQASDSLSRSNSVSTEESCAQVKFDTSPAGKGEHWQCAQFQLPPRWAASCSEMR